MYKFKKIRFIDRGLLVFILLLGLLNPTNKIDGLLGATLFIYVYYYIFRNDKYNIISSVFALAIVFIYSSLISLGLLYILLGIVIGRILVRLIDTIRIKQKSICLFPILLIFFTSSFLNSHQLRTLLSINPAPGQYTHDMGLFLKTYYYMSYDNLNYYQAYNKAYENHAYFGEPPKDVWSWRMPTVFYVWQVFSVKNGVGIWYIFIFLCSLTFYASYNIVKYTSKSKEKYSIIGAYLIFPYLHFAARDWTMLQVEWWAIFSMIYGLYFFFNKNEKLSVIFLSIAVLIRELLIIPVGAFILVNFILNKTNSKKYLIPIIIFVLFLAFHTYFINRQVGLNINSSLYKPRLNGGKDLLFATLAFGSWEYFLFKLRPFLLMLPISIIGTIYNFSKEKIFLISILVLPVSYLIIGTGELNDVWGVLYVPLLLLQGTWVLKEGIS